MSFLNSIHDLNIFVVEPSAAQSLFLAAQLKEIGVSVITVFKKGADVLKAMHENLPDVVISSMHLQDMTGGELVAHMRCSEVTRHIAFILISSESNPHYLELVRQSGSSAILGKPFSAGQLKKALVTALDYLSPESNKLEIGSEINLEALKVLLVDDSRSALAYIRRVLENLGIQNISEALNGRQAVEIIQNHYFDLVVTDYNMPEMDGRELTEYIRTQSWQSTVPILMVTSENNPSRLAAVSQAGVSGVCDKPFEPALIKALLEKMLRTE
jgi:two-component system, chemotaxis family, chemotaxis protein CheY